MLSRSILALTLCSAILSGCSKQEADAKKADPAVLAALAAKAALPPEKNPDGISVDGIEVSKSESANGGSDLDVTATLKNASTKAVEGVNLVVTFLDASGIEVGGHNTQQYFDPPLAAGKSQVIVLRAVGLFGLAQDAKSARVEVLNLARAGQTPDGWKPLDPKNMPAPKIVEGSSKALTADGRLLESSLSPPPATPSKVKEPSPVEE